jgi:hypothetical protein
MLLLWSYRNSSANDLKKAVVSDLHHLLTPSVFPKIGHHDDVEHDDYKS